MIKHLKVLDKEIEVPKIEAQEWAEWEHNKATVYYKAMLRLEVINALDNLVSVEGKEQFYRGQIQAFDQAINFTIEVEND